MSSCDRAEAVIMNGDSSLLLINNGSTSSPKSRSFELVDDTVHYAPDRPADVTHVKLVIELNFEQETISGTVYTTFSAIYEELKSVVFDAIDLHIERVTLVNGKELAFSSEAKKLIVTLDRPYTYGEEFTVAVTYSAKPRTGLHFMKPVKEDPTRPVQAWTFGQPSYHRNWFPCHDSPNDRATTEIIVTVPARFTTISNGNLLDVTDNGATKTHHWRHDIPHAAYLISLVVGEFAVIKDDYKGIPVTYYVRPDRKDDALYYMGKTPAMMHFFSDYTGVEYPYEKYAQTVVEIYTGAMEHTTATTHSFSLLLDQRASLDVDLVSVVAHELAHQWFGDLVTCRDWPNGWLNEGFATYFEELWNEHDLGNDYFKQSMLSNRKSYLTEDENYRRPIVYHIYHDDGFELFDSHMYLKGAWVLHMLRHQLGDPAFRRAIKTYLKRYREREVITADLERTFEEVTGRSLTQFFQQWVYQAGYPAFEVSYAWDNEHHIAKVKIKQTQEVDELTPCFVTPVDLAFTVPVSDEAARDEHTTSTRTIPMRVIVGEDGQIEQSFYIPLEREPVMVRFDPDGWLLKTLKFERSAKMMRYQLKHDLDVLGRIEAAEALGIEASEKSMDALKFALLNDTFWGVRRAAAAALGTIGSEAAQSILLQALEQLDATQFSRVRSAIVSELGRFQKPPQTHPTQRSAQALVNLLERGDVSYVVEATAAESLGKTRITGSVEQLIKFVERPSWMNVVQGGIFRGLAATGDDRVVDMIGGFLLNATSHPTLRRVAAGAMGILGQNRHLYSEEARQRAVTVLCHTVEHDSWAPVRTLSASALKSLGEKRALAILEQTIPYELDTRVQRSKRLAVHALRSGDKPDEQLTQLRNDLDLVREENRKLREQMNSLEAKIK